VFFKVRAQVDRDLTTVSWVDRLLGLTKNLGRHTRALVQACHPRAGVHPSTRAP
jgi:hypothetical protein